MTWLLQDKRREVLLMKMIGWTLHLARQILPRRDQRQFYKFVIALTELRLSRLPQEADNPTKDTPMPLFESQPWLLVPLIVITIEAWAALKARLARRNNPWNKH